MSTRTARPEASSAVLATLGVATFVLGLMALVLSPLVVGGLLGLVGITLGLVQVFLGRVKRALAVWGIALSVVGVMGSVGAGITYYRWYLSEGQEVGAHEEEASGLEHWAGAPVPALSLTSLEGEALDTEALKGRRVVLNFWATWCKACREEIPHLNKLATEASSEITVIGISNEPEETLRAFARENALSYKVVSADDLPAPFHERPGIPTTAFIDKNGMIEEAVLGYQGYETLRSKALR